MDLKHLKNFVAIAEAGSISKAASLVHTVQPALSAHLSSLERDLGTQLFIRTSRGVELTDAGEKLLGHAKFILHRIDLARSEVQIGEAELSGQVKIGCLHGLADAIAPTLIPALKREFPGISPALLTYSSDELKKNMIESELDMYITYSSVSVEDSSSKKIHDEEQLDMNHAEVHKICQEELYYCTLNPDLEARQSGIQFSKEPVSGDEIERTRIAAPPPGQAVHRMLKWVTGRNDIELNIFAYGNSMKTVVDWVVAGECAAILPSVSLKRVFRSLPILVRPIADYKLSRGVVFCGSPEIEQYAACAAAKPFILKFLLEMDL